MHFSLSAIGSFLAPFASPPYVFPGIVFGSGVRLSGAVRRAWMILWLCLLLPLGAAERKLVIISAHWEGYKAEVGGAFARWHEARYGEKVDIEWRDVGGGTDMLKFVLSEYKQRPDGIGIDLVFGGGLDPYLSLKDEKRLEVYTPPARILQEIPPSVAGLPLYDPEHTWYGTALAGFGILSNKRVVRIRKLPEVKEWKDLANPALYSWVGSGDPRASGSAAMLYEIILQAYGWEEGWKIIISMAGNIRAFNKNSSMAVKETTFGDVAYCLAIDVYGLRQVNQAGPENMAFLYPEGLTIINPDCIGMLKGAPNRETAGRFIDFILSTEGQKLWVMPKGTPGGPRKFDIPRMSILPQLYKDYPKGMGFMDPFNRPMKLHYDAGLGKSRRAVIQALLGSTVIEPHAELVKGWRRIVESSASAEQKETWIRAFTTPPVDEATALALAQKEWNDPRIRTRLLREWQIEAVKKYRSIADEARNP